MKRAVFVLVVALVSWVSAVDAFILAPPDAKVEPPVASEATATPESPITPEKPERFPIVTRVDLSRDYGYFIGDEIPLTVIIEAAEGVVLDLVNLPRAGEQHGPLEIREFNLTTSVGDDEVTIYKAEYRMQYFGIAPFTIQLEPLEILYATAQSRDAVSQTYAYKSLFTQPVTIDISRIGPYRPTQAQEARGPLSDHRTSWLWISWLVGAICIFAAAAGWGRECWQMWKQRPGDESSLSTAQKVLQKLHQIEDAPPAAAVELTPAVSQLGAIVRAYLQDSCGVSAYTLTPSELAARLDPSPELEDVVGLLERCETLKYQPGAAPAKEEKFLWEEAVTIFEHID